MAVALPYGYYTFLRLAVCVVAAWGAYNASQLGEGFWMVVLGAMALLFNPIVPVYLERETWRWIDIIGAVVFWVSSKQLSEREAQVSRATSGQETM